MAFKLAYEVNNTGMVGDYWRITDLNINLAAGTISTVASLYVDRTARDLGKSPIHQLIDVFVLTDFIYRQLDVPAVSMLDIYNTLKTTFYVELKKGRFSMAEDV